MTLEVTLNITKAVATLADMAAQGGGTLDLTTGQAATLEDGYYVGGAYGILPWIFPSDPVMAETLEVTGQWADAVASMAGQGATYVGVWEHAGMYYVDATEWYADRSEAIEAGARRGEIAIWGIADSEEITLLRTA